MIIKEQLWGGFHPIANQTDDEITAVHAVCHRCGKLTERSLSFVYTDLAELAYCDECYLIAQGERQEFIEALK